MNGSMPIDLCVARRGRSRALPGGRPGSVQPMSCAEGGGSWGNHGFPDV